MDLQLQLSVSDGALDDLRKALSYYESRSLGLGGEFYIEFNRVVEVILHFPKSFQVTSSGLRKACIQSFPYIILYRRRKNIIDIVSVLHTYRDPITWKKKVLKVY